MADPIVISAPAVEPVSLSEARLHLRMDSDITVDDSLIESLIVSARGIAEHELGRKLITQSWDMVLDAFPSSDESIRLHSALWQPQSIAQIVYLDSAGAVQTMDPADYVLDAQSWPGYVFLAEGASWPADIGDGANAVKIRVVCGYGNAGSDVPSPIKAWMKLQIGTMYAQREGIIVGTGASDLPSFFSDRLLDPYRVSRP